MQGSRGTVTIELLRCILFNRAWDVCKGYPETTGVCFEVESLVGGEGEHITCKRS
jgi:hypothetical protein